MINQNRIIKPVTNRHTYTYIYAHPPQDPANVLFCGTIADFRTM